MSTESAPQRLQGLDGVKGVAIVFVVLIHASPQHPSIYTDHIIGGLARLAVPCFLVVSGYLAGLKASPPLRLRGHALLFVRLHLIWAAFYWMQSLVHSGIPAEITLKDVLARFGEGAYSGQFYFVLLIQSYLLAWLVPRRLWLSPAGLALSAAGAVAGVFFLQWIFANPLVRPQDLPSLLGLRALTSANAIWLWFYFFALGALLGDRARRGHRPSTRTGWLLVAAGLAVATLSRPDWPYWGDPSALPYLRFPIYFGASLVALGLPALAPLGAPRPLTRLGADSFVVFVLNPALLGYLALILGPAATPPVSWLYAVLALAVAWALARPLRRWTPFALP